MTTPTFVVGTGRCGSTMLSNMLREHPRVLSVSEFFGYVAEGQTAEAFTSEIIDSRRFWAIIAAISPLADFCSRNRIAVPESLYDRDAPSNRFSWESGVPAVLMTTLPHLTSEHDALYDELKDEVCRWPNSTIGEHYRRLFGWLTVRFDKSFWVERSGTSLLFCAQLLATFPEARFVHMVRDGRDAAISMHQHLGLRLVLGINALKQYLGVDPIESKDRHHLDRVPENLSGFLPESFDADALRTFDVPLPLCGEFWQQQVYTGLQTLHTLSADRLLTLRYEDFFIDPKRQLDTFTAFLGADYVDEDWSARCAATVRKPKSTWRDLPEDEARALTDACRPGFEALAAAGVDYAV